MSQPLLVIRVTVATLAATSVLTAWPVLDRAPAAPRPVSPSVERVAVADVRAETWTGGDALRDGRPVATRRAAPPADAGTSGAEAPSSRAAEQLVTVGGEASLVGLTWNATSAPPAGTPIAVRGHG
ncbi:MAG: hypothetical protein ACRCZD_16805, partial [Phycicoccus sp.]